MTTTTTTETTFLARSYRFTARPYGGEETFEFDGYLFPGGEVMVTNPQSGDEWYASLHAVEVCDAEVVSFEPTGDTMPFSKAELVESLRQTVRACRAISVDPAKHIPASLHQYAVWYELEGEDAAGCWDASNVTWNPDATRFDTLAEAKAEIDYWLDEGRDVTTLRVVRVSLDGREVVYQPPVGEWYKWDWDRCGNHNVSVNDGDMTYYSVWDTADDERSIDLQEVADDFAAGYDHNGEPGPVSITVINLITGEELEDEMVWEEEDENEDGDEDADDDDGNEDAEDDDAIAALWHGEIDFLDHYQPPGRRGR